MWAQTVTIPAGGSRSAQLTVPPINNDSFNTKPYISVRVAPGNGYQVNRQSDIAVVHVNNNDSYVRAVRLGVVRATPNSIELKADPALGLPATGPWLIIRYKQGPLRAR